MCKKLAAVVVAVAAGIGMSTAHSAVDISTLATANADIPFSGTASVTHTLTPVAGLVAGQTSANTVIAVGKIIPSGNARVAMRFTPSAGQLGSGGVGHRVVRGTATNSVLNVATGGFKTNGVATTMAWQNEWAVFSNGVTPGMDATYDIITYGGTQTVAPDVYPVSMDAAVYLP